MSFETTHQAQEKTIDVLCTLLRGELSAVETYRQAIEKLDDSPYRQDLEECLRSHQRRVTEVRTEILSLGGKPPDSSGAWGAFVKLLEGGAKLFGVKAAIAVLEEGEDHGIKEYQEALRHLDPAVRSVLERLYAEHQQTHAVMSRLKHSLR
jgi:uncharacterized protein (TIGR02284 family)